MMTSSCIDPLTPWVGGETSWDGPPAGLPSTRRDPNLALIKVAADPLPREGRVGRPRWSVRHRHGRGAQYASVQSRVTVTITGGTGMAGRPNLADHGIQSRLQRAAGSGRRNPAGQA